MRSSRRLPYALSAVVCAATLSATGCAGAPGSGAARPAAKTAGHEVLLQPAAARGPAPFTRSTAGSVPGAPDAGTEVLPAGGAPATAPVAHAVLGDAAGLYGGVRSTPSCDVDQQADLLAEDAGRARAFARVAGIEAVQIPGYLRALTPVVLRADARVTDHGFAARGSTTFQTVLQAGTAVMADSRGLPRVRCASGDPLTPAVPLTGRIANRGERWADYDPERVVDITPSTRVLDSLVIADLVAPGWIERPLGEGAEDLSPADPPASDPGDAFLPSPSGAPDDPGGLADDADSGPPAAGPDGESTAGGPDAGDDFAPERPDPTDLPDFTGDASTRELPDFTGEAYPELPDFTGDAYPELPDLTGEAYPGLPDFTGDGDAGAPGTAGHAPDADGALPDFAHGAYPGGRERTGGPAPAPGDAAA
ncbi:hypothetical protein OG233_02060 [Streptomyces sp. NBC_01218]|uniref:DUF6777 domain-containing protein n=1 Tax=Streptomyces sp. NBC_01218 TaxID=2903780 RepID=UPI002E0DB83C|nr:hypothetical protein OG233_02060 [Streptomyces sp. NBC_01218]